MDLSGHVPREEPFYASSGTELALARAACEQRLPIMLKGPTGCGKTRFVEHLAWLLQRPLITVACHEDMTAADLVGRYLLSQDGTIWQDGPLTEAVRHGAICYLDEIVEARQDTVVVIHPLADTRRVLPLDRKAELVHAHPDFQLLVSYNPGYQSASKDLKVSTRQRFIGIDFAYPDAGIEADIVCRESGLDRDRAVMLVQIGDRSRRLRGHGLDEGASTRMLIHAGRLLMCGVPLLDAVRSAISIPLTDEPELQAALDALASACAD